MTTLFWFKRDLRVHDNPAFAQAAAQGEVLPVYVVEPDLWAQSDASARQWAFVSECVDGLRRELAALGQPLLIRTGDVIDVFEGLRQRHGITRLLASEETGNGWTYARDLRVAAWARDRGVAFVELAQSGVVRRLKGRDGWAAQRDAFMAAPQAETPLALKPVAPESGSLPDARALRLPEDRCANRQRGGRVAGLALLDSFLDRRGESYRFAMSSPLSAERACSRLSPYIAHGALSLREVVQATASARAVGRGRGGWAPSLRSFEARLAWRDHFIQKLEDEPAIEHRAMHPALDDLRPRDGDAARLAAWERGETGLPFVDACMRYLNATGWINFRMRAMLVSVATYHLWLDWRTVGLPLARLFTDYEPGIHWSQCQMQAGVTGINTIRMYNPVKQGLDQDPEGRFIRRWLPELSVVPDGFVHEPWKWPDARQLLGRRYPEPVVDPVAAARAAREKVFAARKGAGFREQAASVVVRHASRKKTARKPVVGKTPSSAQLTMEF
jgi:deoxyribodipyrimidine photo-lyase